jgi:hypothetical protein
VERSDKERKRIDLALLALAEALNHKCSETMLYAYQVALDDCALHEIQEACRQSLKRFEWFPKPIELRRLAVRQRTARPTIADDRDAIEYRAYKALRGHVDPTEIDKRVQEILQKFDDEHQQLADDQS